MPFLGSGGSFRRLAPPPLLIRSGRIGLTDALKREAPGGIQPGAEEALKVHRYFMTLKSSAARDARCGKKDRTRPGAGFELMREHYLSRPRFARRLLLPASNLT